MRVAVPRLKIIEILKMCEQNVQPNWHKRKRPRLHLCIYGCVHDWHPSQPVQFFRLVQSHRQTSSLMAISGCADPCKFPKCVNLDCVISVGKCVFVCVCVILVNKVIIWCLNLLLAVAEQQVMRSKQQLLRLTITTLFLWLICDT